ncbi:MAG: hypothetical protein KGI57_01845 [Hyphomicrobiales bacterium]|nr:hypothetical protein [Hyphomicrobiales bacterium]
MTGRPLRNRVDPFGALHATPERGRMMGNRGGRFHDEAREIGGRTRAGRRWICCVLEFRGRRREVWGAGYTQLFFADEATALAAGHRPCFECRRAAARAFAAAFGRARGTPPASADEMDAILDVQRRAARPEVATADLPVGAMVAVGDAAVARRDGGWARWAFAGSAPTPDAMPSRATLLTPPATLATLRAGYRPDA